MPDENGGLDVIDQQQNQQLHQVVLQLSKNCFEIKKICLTVLGSASILIATFTSDNLDTAHFVCGGIVVTFFYALDVQSYYYQEKIRQRMDEIVRSMTARSGANTEIVRVGIPTKETSTMLKDRLLHAILNPSMLFYLALAIIIGVVAILHGRGHIQSYGGS